MEQRYDINSLFDYYKNQIFKMLGLFESRDENGYKFGIKIISELEKLPNQFNELYGDYRFNVVLAKVDAIVDELLLLDGEHQFVKSHVMETLNLLDDIREDLL